MPKASRRSSAVLPDPELRLPRPPGVIRRFWARHPLVTDILIALVCLAFSLGPFTAAAYSTAGGSVGATVSPPAALGAIQWFLVLACASLLLRRRRPWVPFSLGVVAELAFLVAPSSAGMPVLVAATYSLAVYRSNRACWIGFGAASGAVALTTAVAAALGSSPSPGLNALAVTIVAGLIGALIGVNVGNRKRYLEAVIGRSRQLLVERDQQAQLAAAAERTRIAREMHDIVSHSLTVVVALAEGAVATSDPARARTAMDAVAATARTALAEMRATLGVLRTDDPSVPFAPAQPVSPHDTVAAAQRAGFPVTLAVTGEDASPPAVRYAVGRIVQEGVTNAMRHAPRATQVRVRIDHGTERVRVEIMNDGVRDGGGSGGFGLTGLVERASHVGGTLHSGPAGGDRWLLHADLPTGGADGHPDTVARQDAFTDAEPQHPVPAHEEQP